MIPVLLTVALTLLLSACGGGGTPAAPPAAAPPPPPVASDVGAVARADPGSPLPADWVHGAFMQIFVRSYQDSDGDGVGDLRGLIQRLPYLQQLGVRGLWLLPVARSQDGDHGYAVTDYRSIEPAYGSLADFDELLRQAHARSIGVVLDYVVNHSAAQHPAFQSARGDPNSPYRDWYVWQAAAPAGWSVFGNNPWRSSANGAYYAPFWDQMPDWNLRQAAVREFHRNNLRFWLNRGVDGFRFDAVGLLFENGPAAWEDQAENFSYLRDEVAAELSAYARRFMVCEGPVSPVAYAAACGRAFAFGLQGRLIDAARGRGLQAWADAAPAAGLSPFLSNHDGFAGERPWHALNGELPALKLAAALNLLREGTPFIYYGEEIGMGHGAALQGDARLRSPMSWTADNRSPTGFSSAAPYRALAVNVATQNVAAQQDDPDSLLNHYRALLALRQRHAALSQGRTEGTRVDGAVLRFWRRHGAASLLVLVNSARAASLLQVDALPPGARLARRFGPGTAEVQADAAGRLTLELPAQSVHVLETQP